MTLIVVTTAGCSRGRQRSDRQWDKIKVLETKVTILEQQTKLLTAENEELKKNNSALSGFDKNIRMEVLNRLDRVEIHSRSGLFDKDKDRTKEQLIVYLRPIDDTGDSFKAPGTVEIDLWNLSAQPSDARLGKWTVEQEQLKKLWSGSFMTSYYRLTFDLDKMPPESAEELTVKAKFTDYITGKSFNAQFSFEKNK